jgi:hypothetical protein
VTDLLVLRRREDGRPAAATSWETVTSVDLDGQPTKVNRYFTDHPKQVLGVMSLAAGDARRADVDGDRRAGPARRAARRGA